MNLPSRKTIVWLLILSLVLSSFMAFLANEMPFVSAQSTSVSPPTFSPPGGTYSSPQNVMITCATTNSFIRYTLDGSEPSDMPPMSPLYNNRPISVSANTTIKAKAYILPVTGTVRSDTVSATYTIVAVEKVAMPTFSPDGGSYSGAQSVVIQCATSGAIIRYTTSGDEPSSISTVYVGSILVSANTTIKAKAFFAGMTDSDTASAIYTISEAQNLRNQFPTVQRFILQSQQLPS